MKFQLLLLSFFLFLALAVHSQNGIKLNQIANGYNRPLDVQHCGDSRLFVVTQPGEIFVMDSAYNKTVKPFLNIKAKVIDSGNERGLLGLAFHPNYKQNGYFYVNYIDNAGNTTLSRFKVSATNPDSAVAASEFIILTVAQPFSNHNGGCVLFGPDGYLYIASGDGGSGGDPQNNGQKKNSLLGKLLRIDVDNGTPYSVPASNPFVGDPQFSPEIWSYGLRNPWRFSFDALNGDIWIGDVGQEKFEEINLQLGTSPGGENYGWRCYEGNATYNTNGCGSVSNYDFPVFEYPHGGGDCSVTGGYVYRGSKYPGLYGNFLYADYCSGNVWMLTKGSGGTFTNQVMINSTNQDFSSFGEGSDGQLYVCGLSTGRILKLDMDCPNFILNGSTTPTCKGQDNGSININVSGGGLPYSINWSNNSNASTLTDLEPGSYVVTVTDSKGCGSIDSFAVEEIVVALELDGTPSCIDSNNGSAVVIASGSEGYTYNWNTGNNIDSLQSVAGGTYYVTVTDKNGCVISDSVFIATIDLDPSISIEGDTLSALSQTNNIYNWSFNGSSIKNGLENFVVAQASGFYGVTVTDPTGLCSESDSISFVPTYVNQVPLRNVKLAPNPVNNQLNITINDPSIAGSIELFTASGLFCREIMITGTNTQLNMESYQSGMYILKIKTARFTESYKIIKN